MSGKDHRFLALDKAGQLKGAVDHKRTGTIYMKLEGSVDFHQRISCRTLRIGAKFILLPPPIVLFSLLANTYFNHLAIFFLPSTLAVIQDVDNASLEGQYQSFASLMEQRLAELFVLAGRQGTRFRRATAVGGFTVQVRDPRRGATWGASLPTFSVRVNSLRCAGIERKRSLMRA